MSGEAPQADFPSASDAEQIRNLYAQLAFAYDEGRAEEYAALFTEDGAFEVAGGPETRGGEELAGTVVRAAARPDRTLHMVSSVLVAVAGDSASGRAYVQLLALADGALRCLTVGTYEDTYVRTAAGWRVSRRRFTPEAGPDPRGLRIVGA